MQANAMTDGAAARAPRRAAADPTLDSILDSVSRIDMLQTTLLQLIASKPHGFDPTYDTLYRVCRNPLLHPGIPKYTTLKLDNKIISNNVLSGAGGLEFLMAAGALGWARHTLYPTNE